MIPNKFENMLVKQTRFYILNNQRIDFKTEEVRFLLWQRKINEFLF